MLAPCCKAPDYNFGMQMNSHLRCRGSAVALGHLPAVSHRSPRVRKGGSEGLDGPFAAPGFPRAFSTCCSQRGQGMYPLLCACGRIKGIFKARKQQVEPGMSKALTPYGSIGFGCCDECSAPMWFGLSGSILQQSGAGSAKWSKPIGAILEACVLKYIVRESDLYLPAEIICN